MRNGSSTLGNAGRPQRHLQGVTAHQDLLVPLEDLASRGTKVPLGCPDVWEQRANQARRAPQEMPGCPSSVPVAPLVSRAHEVFLDFRVPLGWTANRAAPDQRERWGLKDKKEKRVSVESTPTGAYLGLLDQRETRGSRATTAGRESGACRGCQANKEPRVSQGPQEPRVRRGLWVPPGYSASWGRREKKVMPATPLEEAEGSPVPQGSRGPRGQRGTLELMARLAPQDDKETRGSLEQLENRDLLAPRAPRVNQGKESWWTTTGTSVRLSRRSGHWP